MFHLRQIYKYKCNNYLLIYIYFLCVIVSKVDDVLMNTLEQVYKETLLKYMPFFTTKTVFVTSLSTGKPALLCVQPTSLHIAI